MSDFTAEESSQNFTYSEQNGAEFVLRDYHKVFICRCCAQLMGLKDIVLAFQSEFRDEIEDAGLWEEHSFSDWLYARAHYFSNHQGLHRKWRTLIVELHEQWRDGIAELILAHKRARVEELQKEFFQIEGSTPDKVLDTDEGRIVVQKRNTESKIRVLEQIRREVEGETLRIGHDTETERATDESIAEAMRAKLAEVKRTVFGEEGQYCVES